MNPRARPFKNRVLASLPASELGRLSPHLVPVDLPQHKSLLDGKAKEAYFLEVGIASVVVTLEEGDTVEVGVIGNDGVVGIPGLLGVENGTSRTFMQIQGSGYSIKPHILREEFERPGRTEELSAEVHAGVHGADRSNRRLQSRAWHRRATGALAAHLSRSYAVKSASSDANIPGANAGSASNHSDSCRGDPRARRIDRPLTWRGGDP